MDYSTLGNYIHVLYILYTYLSPAMIPHSQCLRSICRLCGVHVSRAVVAGRNPILKEKFAKQIFIAFNIVIQDDVSDVHPQFICKVCEVKLRQWWSKFSHKYIKTAKYTHYFGII